MPAQTVKAGRITVELSHTGKVLFPEDGITKGDLVAYYQTAAGMMLPPRYCCGNCSKMSWAWRPS
jgi:DNA primase